MLHFSDDFHTFTPGDARARSPSLILFSLDLKIESMRRFPLFFVLVSGWCNASSLAEPRIDSPVDEFRAAFGAPSYEEKLVRTATRRWKPLRTRDAQLLAAEASAIEVFSLDVIACVIVLRCKRAFSNADVSQFAQRFLRRYRAADFEQYTEGWIQGVSDCLRRLCHSQPT